MTTTPAYITAADLAAFFSAKEVSDLTTSGTDAAGVIDTTNAEVHVYLAPLIGDNTLNSVPAGVKMKAADIARFYLYKNSPSDAVTKRWQAANAFFTQVATGVITLVLDLSPPEGSEDVDGEVWSQPGTALPACEWNWL